jgi:nucleotide sugar dehydrogenase
MNVTVVGLGKIGLPLAVQFAKKNSKVFGADINPETVKMVNNGIEPFPGEDKLQEFLTKVIADGTLVASTNTTECVSFSDVIIVVVPLFVNEKAEPDFRALDSATIDIAKGLKKGSLVSYETTLPVGTTRNRFTKALEEHSGMSVGIDFHVSFSPERVLTGRVFSDLRKYPKIVAGITSECAEIAKKFYSEHLDFDPRTDLSKKNGVWLVGSVESAEFVKLAETTYRDVNIGLANQFAKFADELCLDIYEVITSANSQPFSHIHSPGISVGGHCIPIYPQFYLWNNPTASIVQSARETNAGMPEYAISKILNNFGSISGRDILIFGLSYRDGVKEDFLSGTYDLQEQINAAGGRVVCFDPLYTDEELIEKGFTPLNPSLADTIEIAILHNTNELYVSKIGNLPSLKYIYDGRNFLDNKGLDSRFKVQGLGNWVGESDVY